MVAGAAQQVLQGYGGCPGQRVYARLKGAQFCSVARVTDGWVLLHSVGPIMIAWFAPVRQGHRWVGVHDVMGFCVCIGGSGTEQLLAQTCQLWQQHSSSMPASCTVALVQWALSVLWAVSRAFEG